MTEKEVLDDMIEFMQMLDFERLNDHEIKVVDNIFRIKELPAFVQTFIQKYFNYVDTIR